MSGDTPDPTNQFLSQNFGYHKDSIDHLMAPSYTTTNTTGKVLKHILIKDYLAGL